MPTTDIVAATLPPLSEYWIGGVMLIAFPAFLWGALAGDRVTAGWQRLRSWAMAIPALWFIVAVAGFAARGRGRDGDLCLLTAACDIG